jgi:hypothetical protein
MEIDSLRIKLLMELGAAPGEEAPLSSALYDRKTTEELLMACQKRHRLRVLRSLIN